MTDLLITIYYLPLTTAHIFTHVWAVLAGLPWPSGNDWFRWFLFLILGKLVWFVISFKLNPGHKYSNRISENGAAASIGSVFHH